MAASMTQSTGAPSAMPAEQIPLRQAWYSDQLLREYRTGYPYASEEELQMLMEAEEKNGYPADDLQHAKEILGKA